MASSRIVVTFVTSDRQEMPWFVEGTTARSGMSVFMAPGVDVRLRYPRICGRKGIGGGPITIPWDVLQVVINVGVPIAEGTIGSLIAAWIWRKRQERADGSKRPPDDQTTVNVYIGEVKVGPSVEEIVTVVRDALAEAQAPIEVPREVREHNARALAMSLEEYDDWLAD